MGKLGRRYIEFIRISVQVPAGGGFSLSLGDRIIFWVMV